MKTLLKSPKNTFWKLYTCPATSGRFRPSSRSEKSRKSSKNRKNRDFSKIEILLYSGRKYNIWPEIGPLDPGKPPESLYWPSHMIWLYFEKNNKKNRIFHLQNQHKNFFPADYFGRCGSANKSISGVNKSYSRPQTPIILGYTPHPFLPVCIIKNSQIFPKIVFFHKRVVFVVFVAFWVLLMLFFKISKISRCCYVFLFFSYDV